MEFTNIKKRPDIEQFNSVRAQLPWNSQRVQAPPRRAKPLTPCKRPKTGVLTTALPSKLILAKASASTTTERLENA
jgi:hypothetical protein